MTPALAVAVVAQRDHLRLRWLLNALSEQTVGASFDVVVAHDGQAEKVSRVLASHPLRREGRLRAVVVRPGHAIAVARNAAWRATTADLVLFTEEGCRPASHWVEQALSAARAHLGAIVEGATVPDPDQSAILHGASWPATVTSTPPSSWARACNIAYPREVLQRLQGFDVRLPAFDDADLALRAQSAGVGLIPAPAMMVYHVVAADSLPGALWRRRSWRHLPLLVRRHRSLRRAMWWRCWMRPQHAALALLLGGALARQRAAATALLSLPWIVLSARPQSRSMRAAVRAVAELPGRAAIDAAELLLLARGSVRYRTVVL